MEQKYKVETFETLQSSQECIMGQPLSSEEYQKFIQAVKEYEKALLKSILKEKR